MAWLASRPAKRRGAASLVLGMSYSANDRNYEHGSHLFHTVYVQVEAQFTSETTTPTSVCREVANRSLSCGLTRDTRRHF